MAAYDTGKMILFVRSILWYLGIPQEAATLLYKDNNGCTAMGNAQKPTHGHATSTSNTSHCVDGLNAILSSLIELTLQSTCPTTLPNLCSHFSSIDTLISSLDMSLQVTHQFIPLWLGHTPITPLIFTSSSLSLSLPHLQPLLLGSMHHLRQIMPTVRGYTFLGMVIQSSVPMILFVCLVHSFI
jgi:hypothetical protein